MNSTNACDSPDVVLRHHSHVLALPVDETRYVDFIGLLYRNVDILARELPAIRNVPLGTDMGFISIIEVDLFRFAQVFKFRNHFHLMAIISSANTFKKRRRVLSLIDFPREDSHSAEIKRIPSTLSDEKMELELFKIQQSLDLEVKQEAKEVLKFVSSETDKEYFTQKHQDLFNKIIEVGNSKLSDEIGFEDHNLWMIDDKLSYHKYLASDKKFKTIEPVNSELNDRPDLIVFNRPFAFANDNKPYQSIVLVEFKRPMRDDYGDEENPITQINRYAREIIEGEAEDKNSREFDFRTNTPIYAYIVCNLTKKLKAYAKDGGYRPLPDGDGYFFFNDNYNMYVEIMSFDKILNDSKEKKRNEQNASL